MHGKREMRKNYTPFVAGMVTMVLLTLRGPAGGQGAEGQVHARVLGPGGIADHAVLLGGVDPVVVGPFRHRAGGQQSPQGRLPGTGRRCC